MVAQKPPRQLDLLAYHGTRELLGTAKVTVRALDASVRPMWQNLDSAYKATVGNAQAMVPRSIAATALRCLTGGYVHFDPEKLILATREPLDDETIRDTFTLLYHLVHGAHIDEIDLGSPPLLAEKIASSVPVERSITQALRHNAGGQVDAPDWVFRTIAWEFSQQLAKEPWLVDDHKIVLSPDSDGGLIAWADPWPGQSGNRYSLARIRVALKTVPNLADPLFLLSANATRIASSMAYARTVLVEQADPLRPIVEVALDGRGNVRRVNKMALEILGRLGIDRSVLHSVADRIKTEEQARAAAAAAGQEPPRFSSMPAGKVRPVLGKNFSFPVGTGVGMHFYRELDRHVRGVFGEALRSPEVRSCYPGFRQHNDLPTPAAVSASITAMGYKSLRLVCLWSRDETRHRMINGLCKAYGLNPGHLDPADGEAISLHGESVTAVFRHAPQLLEHGPARGRAQALALVESSLTGDDSTLVAAWCETSYDAPGIENPAEDEDAKHQSHQLLADRLIPTQYLNGAKVPAKGDHPVERGLADLYRSIGIVDERIQQALDFRPAGNALPPIALCGIHVRRQATRRGERGGAKICVTATVLKPPAEDGSTWTMHGWSYTDRHWRPYHQAQCNFHARPYPTGKLTELADDEPGRAKVAEAIDDALEHLAEYLGQIPYAVIVDAKACRRLYPGLQNVTQGTPGSGRQTWLPGGNLSAAARPAAVIRINTADDEVAQAISYTDFDSDGQESDTGKTTTRLFELSPDFGEATWMLCNVPRQFDSGIPARLGEDKTRWDASPAVFDGAVKKKSEIKQNWYSMTTTEIFPIGIRPGLSGRALAIAVAKLSHQTLSWNDRARNPVPLHAAEQMDLDHPQFRRTAPAVEKETAEPDAELETGRDD